MILSILTVPQLTVYRVAITVKMVSGRFKEPEPSRAKTKGDWGKEKLPFNRKKP